MYMVKTLSKLILFVLLLTVMAGQIARAEVKLYRYDGKLPFIRMMLGMMDAMGVIDRVPANGGYGGYGGYPSSPWSNSSNPYMRALAKRGIYPGSSSSFYNNSYRNNPYRKNLYRDNVYSGNPFTRSPWLQSPWSQYGGGYGTPHSGPLWGSPDWGVLPSHSYSTYDYPGYPQSYWSSSNLDGWVNEPWEKSQWNPGAETTNKSIQTQAPQQPQARQLNVPLVQNFNFGAPENEPSDGKQSKALNNPPGSSVKNRSPLSKLAPPRQPGQQSSRPPVAQQRKPSPLHKKIMPQPGSQQPRAQQSRTQQPRTQQPRREIRQKPCITEFCGLKKPNLKGLWVAQNGELLGINNQKFLWSDGTERYLTGEIKVQNEYLLARAEGREQLMRFKYKLAGDHLLTMQPDGVIREFIRMSPEQYYNQSYGGYQQ